ncbi:MAG: hypothetical protein AAF492_27605, partial [Verrucomicrobiota bacterium]
FLSISVEAESSNWVIRFGDSSSNRNYPLQWTDDLLSPVWSNAPGQINIPGNNNDTDSLTDSTPVIQRRYYRVRVRLP